MEYVKVASTADVGEGKLIPVEARGIKMFLTKVGDAYYAGQRKCPHLGLNLCRGKVEDGAVVCMFHKARFSLETGEIEQDPHILFIGMKAKSNLTVYPVKQEDGALFVGV